MSVACVCEQPQAQAQLNRLKSRTSEHEQAEMSSISEADVLTATLLPIKTVGVQVCNSNSIILAVIIVVVAVVLVSDSSRIFRMGGQ